MTELFKSRCVACRVGDPLLTDTEITDLLPQVNDWEIIDSDGVKRLQRVFKVKDFIEAMALTNKIGMVAEKEDHHPLIITEWGKVTVVWWSHLINGLHKNDFIMAAKTDEIYG